MKGVGQSMAVHMACDFAMEVDFPPEGEQV